MAIRSPFDLFEEMDRMLDEMRRSMWSDGAPRRMGRRMDVRSDVEMPAIGRSHTHDAGVTVEEIDASHPNGVLEIVFPAMDHEEEDEREGHRIDID